MIDLLETTYLNPGIVSAEYPLGYDPLRFILCFSECCPFLSAIQNKSRKKRKSNNKGNNSTEEPEEEEGEEEEQQQQQEHDSEGRNGPPGNGL